MRTLFLAQRCCFLTVTSLGGEREKEKGRERKLLSNVSSNKHANPIMRGLASWTHLTLITSLRHHLPTASPQGLGFQNKNLEGVGHSSVLSNSFHPNRVFPCEEAPESSVSLALSEPWIVMEMGRGVYWEGVVNSLGRSRLHISHFTVQHSAWGALHHLRFGQTNTAFPYDPSEITAGGSGDGRGGNRECLHVSRKTPNILSLQLHQKNET